MLVFWSNLTSLAWVWVTDWFWKIWIDSLLTLRHFPLKTILMISLKVFSNITQKNFNTKKIQVAGKSQSKQIFPKKSLLLNFCAFVHNKWVTSWLWSPSILSNSSLICMFHFGFYQWEYVVLKILISTYFWHFFKDSVFMNETRIKGSSKWMIALI